MSDEPSELFTFLKNNQGYLSGQHCVQALQKLVKSSVKYDDIKNKDGFAYLCNELKKQITTLDVMDAVSAINALTKLKVDNNTVIYESILQIIRSNINSLTIEDIISLQTDLENVNGTQLTNAILASLPQIFNVQLKKIDRENISILAIALVFATKLNRRNNNDINFLLRVISNYSDNIPLMSAKLIFKSMRILPYSANNFKSLLKRLQNILIQQVDSLSFNDAMVILKAIAFHKM